MEDSGSRLVSAARGCLEPFMTLSTAVVVLVLGGLVFLAYGIREGSVTAYLVLGGLVTLGIVLVGVALTVGIIAFAYWLQGRSDAREQERFRDNTKENLAQMEAMAKVQIQQARAQATHNSMLLRQAREARQLPAPVDGPSIEFDEGIFDELEMGD